MNATEVKSLKQGDKVSWVGRAIIYEAIVSGPCDASMEVPLLLTAVLKTDDADIIWKNYRKGRAVRENACTSNGFGHGWVSDGSRADDGSTPQRFLELDKFKSY